MRILIDIVHPADVLFFKRPIEVFRARGDTLEIVSRHKDIACDLLDRFGLAHRPLSEAASGVTGLASELAVRDWRMLLTVRRLRPHVMLGFGGVSIAHAGKLTGTPSVAFYDSEGATMQNRLTWPFISRLYVPDCYSAAVPENRTERVPGVKELSYLHPTGFHPDREIALRNGLDPERPNYFVRLVSWRANHDLGKTGWSEAEFNQLMAELTARGRVHLSSERPLPAAYEALRYSGPIEDVHHLMAHCDLYVGESATMASEAAILGTRAVFAGRDLLGYMDELDRVGLVVNGPRYPQKSVNALVEAELQRSDTDVLAARDAYVAACPDWALKVVEAADRAASHEGQALAG